MSHIRGRFQKAMDRLVARYTSSLPSDWRLYRYDIAGSIAHARMLAKQGIISEKDAEVIVQGLESIQEEIEQGRFDFRTELEDIHMAIEARLMEKVGEVGGKLHTARSRNDQVALDLRLFAKEAINQTLLKLRELQRALVSLAEANKDVVIPGYTHLQPAQPVLLAHHLLAYFQMLQRDIERFKDCLKRTDVLPLGSGALAGVGYGVDREFLARELGFGRASQNSLDAVSDRDFVLEYEAAASLCMMHLSRLAEEIILWSSAEFDFVELDEAYATASSIMPQKRNPDVAELARGRTGRVYGRLMALLATMKALPLAYNRDLQEDKEGFFDTVDTLLATLEVFAGMVATLKVKRENARRAAERGYLLATDLADYLVRKGEAFRTAHDIVARLVSYAAGKGKPLHELSITEYREFSPLFSEDVRSITLESSLAARDVVGGTAPKQVARALVRAKRISHARP
ncbi:MAG TPA: argininosuccinate lyase [Dehalococcoidia bacterium]|jgi:argininosuccinate lyase|nr:argininosuccinate lyase [Dehalococcoidia bacterium]